MIRVSVTVFFTTAVSATYFQSTTFALPKVFDERLVPSLIRPQRQVQVTFCFLSRVICTTSGRPALDDRSEEGFLAGSSCNWFFHHVRGSIWLDGCSSRPYSCLVRLADTNQ